MENLPNTPTFSSPIAASRCTVHLPKMNAASPVRMLMLVTIACSAVAVRGAELPLVPKVELQPLAAHVARLQDALEYLGTPLIETDRAALAAAIALPDPARAAERLQQILDARCLFGININPEMRVKRSEEHTSELQSPCNLVCR